MAYAKVEETFWHDSKVRALPERTRNFFLYLLTSPHRNRVGCFVLDPFYAAADIQWPPAQVTAAMEDLERAERIGWDREHRVVFLRHFLKHNALENGKVVIAAQRELTGVPDSPLLSELLTSLERNRKAHYRPLIQWLASRVGNGMPYGSEHVVPPASFNGIGNDTANDTPNGMAFPGPGPGPGSSPLPGPDQNLTEEGLPVVRQAAAVENSAGPVESDPAPPGRSVALDSYLEAHPHVAELVAQLKHEGGANATAATLRYRFLFPDEDATLADESVKGLTLPERERLVTCALLEFRDQGHDTWERPLFTGFVRRLRQQRAHEPPPKRPPPPPLIVDREGNALGPDGMPVNGIPFLAIGDGEPVPPGQVADLLAKVKRTIGPKPPDEVDPETSARREAEAARQRAKLEELRKANAG